MVEWQKILPHPIIGVDEAGRGCLFGPVYAGAVILCPQKDISYLTDSKLLSEKQREQMFKKIMKEHQVGIGFATAREIEEVNILQATFLAMTRAVEDLKITLNNKTGHILVDGNKTIPQFSSHSSQFSSHFPPINQTALVKGDLRAAPISAASIVAKVSRDRLMHKMAWQHPNYQLERHKGYATKVHKQLIARLGPTPQHRRTFAGVKEHL